MRRELQLISIKSEINLATTEMINNDTTVALKFYYAQIINFSNNLKSGKNLIQRPAVLKSGILNGCRYERLIQ